MLSWPRFAEDYFEKLEAPRKQLTIFEDSGHGMIWQEPDKFHALMQQVIAYSKWVQLRQLMLDKKA